MRTRYTSVKGLIDALVEGSGMSRSSVSRATGRSTNFLNKTVRKGSIPNVGLTNEIACACGYEMLFRKDDEELIVTPPELDDGLIG